jgi:elongation factor Ts
VLSTISGTIGVLVAVGCETEPVSNTREFLDFAEAVLEAVESAGPEAGESFDERRLQLVGRLGEQVEIRGAARLEAGDGELLAEYVHPPAEKIGVLVKLRSGDPAFGRRLAMHISFAAPRYRTTDEIPEEEIAQERAIYEQQPDVQSKPEEVRAKIVEGRLRKEFVAREALAEQQWIHDTSKTVAQALSEAGAEVLEFVRYALAE